MPTLLEDSYKNHIGERITNRIGIAIHFQEIQLEEAEKIIDTILTIIDSMKYREELISLLSKLSQGWPFFNEILQEEHLIVDNPTQPGAMT